MIDDEFQEPGRPQGPYDALRDRIDSVDRELIERLVERADLARALGVLKREQGEAVVDPERERHILARVQELAAGRLPPAALLAIYREILNLTRAAAHGPEADGPPDGGETAR